MKRRLTLTSYLLSAVFFLFLCTTQHILAATLSLSPGTGVYQVGGTFTANVVVNTSGQAINAADATISFDTAQLSVVNVSRGPIFGLWVTEPTFSNSAGTISFSGGSPSGYTGSAGTVMSVTFRTKAAGTGRVSFKNGSVLANDGKGTNVLTAMNGGSFTVQAQTAEPTPEVIVEYVAPANTPGAPTVSVEPAPNEAGWLRTNSMSLSWSVPAGVTGVRTLLDESAQTIPTKVYDAPINSIDLSDLDEGVSYFHIQFRNADGWGRVTHVPLRVDTERPTSLVVSQSEPIDVSNPIQILHVEAKDATSPVTRYKLKIDSGEPFEVELESATGTIELPAVDPGYHTVTVEAFDAAGNSIVETYAFTVEAFDRPVFTEYPHELTPGIIPVIKGQTRPHSEVEIP